MPVVQELCSGHPSDKSKALEHRSSNERSWHRQGEGQANTASSCSPQGEYLHVLQGTTCDPGLIFHWSLPNCLSPAQKWLAVYVALSRVRNLDSLKSRGLGKKIRTVIEAGPPEELLAQFEKYIGEKEGATLKLTADIVQIFGW